MRMVSGGLTSRSGASGKPGSAPSLFAGFAWRSLCSIRTASCGKRKSWYPGPRERNLTLGSVCPWLASKLKGSLPYSSATFCFAAGEGVFAAGEISLVGAPLSAVWAAHSLAVMQAIARTAALNKIRWCFMVGPKLPFRYSESGLKKLPRRDLENLPAFLRAVHKIKLDTLPPALVLGRLGFVRKDHFRVHDNGGVIPLHFRGRIAQIDAHLAGALEELGHCILEAREVFEAFIERAGHAPRRVAFESILKVAEDTLDGAPRACNVIRRVLRARRRLVLLFLLVLFLVLRLIRWLLLVLWRGYRLAYGESSRANGQASEGHCEHEGQIQLLGCFHFRAPALLQNFPLQHKRKIRST